MTDRLRLPRFYPILDTNALSQRGLALLPAAEAVLEAGARILQLRHKEYFSRSVFQHAEAIAGLCRQAGALFVINDRADIAVLVDAGLHVGQDDLPLAAARRLLGADRVLGFSTHNTRQVVVAGSQPADYLAIGPVFATTSKDNPDPVVGLPQLRQLRSLVARPLVAIGGITLETAAEVLAAGADSVAVISGVLPDCGDKLALRTRVEEWLRQTG